MKTAQHFLFEEFDPSYDEIPTVNDLQLAITLNPSLEKIERAMEEYTNQFKPVWVDCNERLPEKGQVVIAYVEKATEPHFKIQVIGYDGKSFKEFMVSDDPADKHDLYSEGEYLGITHWMPLPAFPSTITE